MSGDQQESEVDILTDGSPLNDPRFTPRHPPTAGTIPDVIRRWGRRSQLRWFARYRRDIRVMHTELDGYHYDSLKHRGPCCSSCLDDYYEGYDWPEADRCCCRASADSDEVDL